MHCPICHDVIFEDNDPRGDNVMAQTSPFQGDVCVHVTCLFVKHVQEKVILPGTPEYEAGFKSFGGVPAPVKKDVCMPITMGRLIRAIQTIPCIKDQGDRRIKSVVFSNYEGDSITIATELFIGTIDVHFEA